MLLLPTPKKAEYSAKRQMHFLVQIYTLARKLG